MIDLRSREIKLQIDGRYYSITFRPKLFGRVDKNVKVYTSKQSTGFFLPAENVKIEPTICQTISAIEALKSFFGSIIDDITKLLRQFLRRRL